MNAEERATEFCDKHFQKGCFKNMIRYALINTLLEHEADKEKSAVAVFEPITEQRTRKAIRDALREYAKAHSIAEHVALIEECAGLAMTAPISLK